MPASEGKHARSHNHRKILPDDSNRDDSDSADIAVAGRPGSTAAHNGQLAMQSALPDIPLRTDKRPKLMYKEVPVKKARLRKKNANLWNSSIFHLFQYAGINQ
ncbi:MAG: hypothetical protein DIZ78_12060 [endosymbiont of Escarpia spicata]|uniref:Uncharacterized protein n=1 Tax=endosymbiont of Escarpia spicata TaxID=2200908 RepID=A0A370DKP2_9GAMM|nr:MAG: hypothetical protein DIZ78_12060 [endosymbiont of Escarpia spicata]